VFHVDIPVLVIEDWIDCAMIVDVVVEVGPVVVVVVLVAAIDFS